MVREASVDQIGSAIAEQELFLQQVMEDGEGFSSEFAELQCAMHYLEEGGVSWQEMGKMTVEEILERYHQSLQEDVL